MYFEEAKKRLEEEAKGGKFGQKEAAMKNAVKDALVCFCEQDEEFARSAVAELEQERKKRKKERDGMAAFIGVGVCLCVIGACVFASPWWTAVTPMVLLVAVMRKARWI